MERKLYDFVLLSILVLNVGDIFTKYVILTIPYLLSQRCFLFSCFKSKMCFKRCLINNTFITFLFSSTILVYI